MNSDNEVFNNHIIHNNFPLVNETHQVYYVTHFGIMPESDDLNHQKPPILLSGGRSHFMPDDETMLWRSRNTTAWVSGSWKCWGPHDQDDEGDMSLHVKIYTPGLPDSEALETFWLTLWKNIRSGGEGRVLDYAITTGHGDNDPILVALFGSESKPVVHQINLPKTYSKCSWCDEMHVPGKDMYLHTTTKHNDELKAAGIIVPKSNSYVEV